MDRTYDVIVVGAGPAGSSCAKVLAENKVDVLVLEKHPVIGYPLCCAEALSLPFFSKYFDHNHRWISNYIHRVALFSPSGTKLEVSHPNCAVVLDRKIFDRDLALQASSRGAEVKVNSCAVGVLKKNEKEVYGVRVKQNGNEKNYYAKVIVCADGIESQTAKSAGIDTTLDLDQLDSCFQYLLGNIEIEPDRLEFHVGYDLAPGGYAWVFPKGKDFANVGLAVTPALANGKKAKELLDQFVQKRFSRFSVIETMVGAVPCFSRKSVLVKDNLLLVGDAGRLVDSLSGAGIANAILSGITAGEIASEYIRNGHPLEFLKQYEKRFMEKKGRELRFYSFLRKIYLKMKNDDFETVVLFLKDYLKGKEVKGFDPIFLAQTILKSNPKLLSLLKYVIW